MNNKFKIDDRVKMKDPDNIGQILTGKVIGFDETIVEILWDFEAFAEPYFLSDPTIEIMQ